MIKLMNGCDFLLRLQFWFSNCYELNLVRYVLGCGISAPALGHLSSDFNKKIRTATSPHLTSRAYCQSQHFNCSRQMQTSFNPTKLARDEKIKKRNASYLNGARMISSSSSVKFLVSNYLCET